MKNNKTFLIIYSLQIAALFYLFYLTSKTLEPFLDEYVSLTANLGFFTNLDFNAGINNGGSYGVALTSGPISALGGVLGLIIFQDLMTARFLNFVWVFILQTGLVFLVKKYYEINFKILLLFSSLTFMLIPWYYGVLYSIGEIASTYLFFYSIIIFPKNRKVALVLISVCIFFGKFILVIIFSIFYLTYVIQNREIRYFIKDGLIFSIPLLVWLFLVYLFYEKGGVADYIVNFFNFNFTNNRSAGIDRESTSLISYVLSFRDSEVINWNSANILRVFVSPIMFNFGLLYFKGKLQNQLKILVLPVVLSTSAHYLWFWLMSPTKWIRYSQHFLIITILFTLFIFSFINKEINDKKFYLYFSIYLSLFLNSVFLLIGLIAISFYIYFSNNKSVNRSTVTLLLIFFFLNSLNGIFEVNSKTTYEFLFRECIEEINSNDCRNEYENY
jgi:hypothetical protein